MLKIKRKIISFDPIEFFSDPRLALLTKILKNRRYLAIGILIDMYSFDFDKHEFRLEKMPFAKNLYEAGFIVKKGEEFFMELPGHSAQIHVMDEPYKKRKRPIWVQ